MFSASSKIISQYFASATGRKVIKASVVSTGTAVIKSHSFVLCGGGPGGLGGGGGGGETRDNESGTLPT